MEGKGTKILIGILIILIIATGVVMAYKIISDKKNNETQEYKVEITSIDSENNSNNKSMQIKIIDENLLSNTGGIICGMSGSPIIQNNKIVGALTNVLVSDPQIGYGIFADIMIKEMMK